MALDMTGMTLTADERRDEAERILRRILPEIAKHGYDRLSERAAGFMRQIVDSLALLPAERIQVSPKQLL